MLKTNDVWLYLIDVTRRSSLLKQVLGCERRATARTCFRRLSQTAG